MGINLIDTAEMYPAYPHRGSLATLGRLMGILCGCEVVVTKW